jgi:glutamine synthetase
MDHPHTPHFNAQHTRAAKGSDRLAALNWFWKLPSSWSHVQAEYVWVDADGGLRSKTKTITHDPRWVDGLDLKHFPVWNFDGSSTKQAPGSNSEVMLHPIKFILDPFRGGRNVIVLCECKDENGKPVTGNTRVEANKVFETKAAQEAKPWFGFEQEYTLFQVDGRTPLGWPPGSTPPPQGPYYCSAGAEVAFGRDVAEAHYRACLYAGLNISGINAEVMPGQWEFQIGPVESIDGGDQMMLARYILLRVCEMFGVIVSFYPKPIEGDWNGAGLHTNFSTFAMRQPGGYQEIVNAIRKFKVKHQEHISVYGKGNDKRLTGLHETSSISEFSWGVANRGASIRIPKQCFVDQCGYLEDRRPASSADPYLVSAKMTETTLDLSDLGEQVA